MGFLGVYRAIYEYQPQSEGELTLNEGDLLLILEKSTEDEWWTAKRKAAGADEDEPEGLIPNTYIEEAAELYSARALYDYSKQTDEEVTFREGAALQVFDESDPDWTLVGTDGEYGFAPSNYIEKAGASRPALPIATPQQSSYATPTIHDRPIPGEEGYGEDDYDEPPANPAAALAGLIQQRTGQAQSTQSMPAASPVQYTPEASDEEAPPPMPARPQATPPRSYDEPRSRDVRASPSTRSQRNGYDEDEPPPRAGFQMYHIHEMISYNGKNKKMPTTLGLNLPQGIIMIAPEKAKDGPSREWTAEKLTHYSIEGKHVFMELVKPSKSIDFHAGSKDKAKEIVSALGEMAGAARAEGLREVIAAGTTSGQKKGRILYEFEAQADDEVSVAVDDEVIIIDDTQSAEWWVVRRVKNGREGSVPSSYVEVTGTSSSAPARAPGVSVTEQNRRDEERLTREAVRSSNQDRSRQEQRAPSGPLKPDMAKIRTWTDRSGTFKVEAEFLGLKDGKIHLHKLNGVKIAVPAAKMSVDDLEYVERRTGLSLDDEKPLSSVQRRSADRPSDRGYAAESSRSASGAAVQQPEPHGYDWFDFFLACGVGPQICERYAQIFAKDQMGEENMQDIDASLLRNLGVKEGDILRIMKYLDAKYGRVKPAQAPMAESAEADGGLFTGADGGLRNNTRKGRPAPAVQTNDTVDPRAFEQNNIRKDQPVDRAAARPATSGFDDDAWDVKPAKTTPAAPQPLKPVPTSAMSDLSLLSPPLQPTKAEPPAPAAPLQSQPTGANQSFFDQLARPSSNPPAQRQVPQQTGFGNQNIARSTSAPYGQPNGMLQQPLRPQYTAQIAPPGQSMAEINQQRMMQQQMAQQQQLYSQPTGYYPQANGMMPQPTGFQQNFQQPLQPQPTGFIPQSNFGQAYMTQPLQPQPTGNPFGDSARAPFTPGPGMLQPQQTSFQPLQPQQTGYQQTFQQQPLQPQMTGYPPQQQFQPLQPQQTGVGMNGFGGYGQQQGFQSPAQLPPMQHQQQQIAAPLVPQKTGPAPPVRFGMASKLTPQPTGRRANLASATPQNPFGF